MTAKKAAAKKAPAKKAAREKAANPVGAPSTFKQATADRICERIAAGESLRAICRDKRMPAASTVFKWLADRDEFAEQYARAREAQADTLADEIVSIADEAEVTTKQDGEEVRLALDPTAVARNRLRVDARKWVASKLKPRKYGDRTTIAGDPENPLEVRQQRDMTDAELAAIAGSGAGARDA